ncbi:type I inositol polyphosphate 5-phosphatase, putative [Medicago truncatula]|uniref:Type I inositol polyphosphate 5-phosphatase, putative n=1 Tax=Medicago truncatula TaxID=3880 RepID=G7KJZ2_MEDTR|nr:type I inositol polyphosphate 5-phosphatase, putative [Medicago truncatula]
MPDSKLTLIFIGTRNVAGRSPVGSVAVDLDEWLNIKNFADIYFLGYMYDLDSL